MSWRQREADSDADWRYPLLVAATFGEESYVQIAVPQPWNFWRIRQVWKLELFIWWLNLRWRWLWVWRWLLVWGWLWWCLRWIIGPLETKRIQFVKRTVIGKLV